MLGPAAPAAEPATPQRLSDCGSSRVLRVGRVVPSRGAGTSDSATQPTLRVLAPRMRRSCKARRSEARARRG